MVLDRDERLARIGEASATAAEVEEALGVAVLEADEEAQSSLREELGAQRGIISDEQAALVVLNKRIAEANVKANERAEEKQPWNSESQERPYHATQRTGVETGKAPPPAYPTIVERACTRRRRHAA